MRLRFDSLASGSGLRTYLAVSCGVGRRCGSDPELLWLWLWRRQVYQTPSLGTSMCHGCGPRKDKKTKKKKKRKERNVLSKCPP